MPRLLVDLSISLAWLLAVVAAASLARSVLAPRRPAARPRSVRLACAAAGLAVLGGLVGTSRRPEPDEGPRTPLVLPIDLALVVVAEPTPTSWRPVEADPASSGAASAAGARFDLDLAIEGSVATYDLRWEDGDKAGGVEGRLDLDERGAGAVHIPLPRMERPRRPILDLAPPARPPRMAFLVVSNSDRQVELGPLLDRASGGDRLAALLDRPREATNPGRRWLECVGLASAPLALAALLFAQTFRRRDLGLAAAALAAVLSSVAADRLALERRLSIALDGSRPVEERAEACLAARGTFFFQRRLRDGLSPLADSPELGRLASRIVNP